jgi:hypothetical protein
MDIQVQPSTFTPSAYQTDQQFFATKYQQGTRTVYGLAATPGELVGLVPRPDPAVPTEGNRRINASHAEAFARYFIENESWVIPGIILRAVNMFHFESVQEIPSAAFGVMSYPKRRQGDIHILDGQHRILGFFMALDKLDAEIEKARSYKATVRRTMPDDKRAEMDAQKEIDRLEGARDRFYKQRVAVEIQVTDDIDEAKQMFFDIAENALGITASTRARFDSRKIVNRALPMVLEHPLLLNRVDLDKDRVQKNSPFWIPASKVVEIIRTMRKGFEGRVSRKDNEAWKGEEAAIARETNEFFDLLVKTMPPVNALLHSQITAGQMRDTMLLGGQTFIRILAGVYYELRKDRKWSAKQVEEFFTALGPHAAGRAHANSIWKQHAPEHLFNLNGVGPSGRRADSVELMNLITDWAIARAPFVYAAPVPAPAVDADPDEGIDFAPSHSTKQLELELELENAEIAQESKARAAGN